MNTYGTGRQSSYEKAMGLMQQAGRLDLSGISSNSSDKHLAALEKANAWTSQGLDALNSSASAMSGMVAGAAGQGLQMAGDAARQRAEMAAAKAEARERNKSNWLQVGAQAIGTAVTLLCERRLKGDIQSLDADRAWRAVRDIPQYQFRYRSNPGPLAYGPMVDEVELVDESLVRPSMLPDDAEGAIRGFDIMRFQAYESVALAAALNRIEDLEAKVARLTDAVQRLQLDHTLETA